MHPGLFKRRLSSMDGQNTYGNLCCLVESTIVPTWTNTKEDEKHLVDLHKQLFDAMTVNGPAASTFVLNDRTTIVGRIKKIGTENNGGDGGKWQYYREVQIVPEGGGDAITLDFMQLKYVL